jgi:ketosteroid isomerase-like protein
MSQENVEIVREALDAFNRADLAAVMPMLHPDFELKERFEISTSPGPHRGPEAALAWYREGGQQWSSYEVDMIESIPADDLVVVEAVVRATGRVGSVEMTHRFGYLFKLSERRISRLEIFSAPDQAREAAGLSE